MLRISPNWSDSNLLFRNSNEFKAVNSRPRKDVKSSQKAKMESFRGMKIKLTEDLTTTGVSRQWNNIFKVLRKNNFQPKIMDLEKLFFKNES